MTQSSDKEKITQPPASLLNNLYQKEGLTPKYDYVQVESVWQGIVTVGGFTATGAGKSKKEAKNGAAKALLETLVAKRSEGGQSKDLDTPLINTPDKKRKKKMTQISDKKGDKILKDKGFNANNYDNLPVYKDISRKKSGCKEQGLKLTKNASQGFEYFVVIDFEKTRENVIVMFQEIIEFAVVLVDGKTGKIVDHWHEYCTINPRSAFCFALTGIHHREVFGTETSTEVVEKFNLWLEKKCLGTKHTFALVVDGSFNVAKFLRLSCQQEVPAWAEKWINIRRSWGNFYHAMEHMLDQVIMKAKGNAHSGLDDAKNIAWLVSRMLIDGAILNVNEKLELQPKEVAPHHKASLDHYSPIHRTGDAKADAFLALARRLQANH